MIQPFPCRRGWQRSSWGGIAELQLSNATGASEVRSINRVGLRQRLGGATMAKQGLAVAVVLGIPPIVGLIAGTITTKGRCVDPNFFVVCGTVGPLVGLALFVDIAIVINQVFVATQGLTPANKGLGRVLVYMNAGLMVMAESVALGAVGSGARTTFLVTTAVSPLVLQVWLLTETTLFKINALEPTSG